MTHEADAQQYQEQYSDGSFWSMLGKYAKKVGKGIVEKVLWLHYVIKDTNAPT